jgi:hypothetical protein
MYSVMKQMIVFVLCFMIVSTRANSQGFSKLYKIPNKNAIGSTMVSLKNGFLMAVNTSNQFSSDTAFLIRTNAAGNINLSVQLVAERVKINKLIADKNENIYVLGAAGSGFLYQGSQPAFICKFSKSGTLLWSQSYDLGDSDVPLYDGDFTVLEDTLMVCGAAGNYDYWDNYTAYAGLVMAIDPLTGLAHWARTIGPLYSTYITNIKRSGSKFVFCGNQIGFPQSNIFVSHCSTSNWFQENATTLTFPEYSSFQVRDAIMQKGKFNLTGIVYEPFSGIADYFLLKLSDDLLVNNAARYGSTGVNEQATSIAVVQNKMLIAGYISQRGAGLPSGKTMSILDEEGQLVKGYLIPTNEVVPTNAFIAAGKESIACTFPTSSLQTNGATLTSLPFDLSSFNCRYENYMPQTASLNYLSGNSELIANPTGGVVFSNPLLLEIRTIKASEADICNGRPQLTKDYSFSFYPNPAVSEIVISSDHIMSAVTINDAKGMTYLSNTSSLKKEVKLNISTLKPGQYFVCVTYPDGKFVRKVLIKN